MSTVGALGRAFDVASVVPPVDLGSGANTGHFVSMRDCEGVAFVILLAAGTAGENATFTVRSSDAFSGGTPADLDVVETYYTKSEAALDGDETWTKVTQAAGDITDADWDDANEVIAVFEVQAAELPDGHTHVSVNVDDPGTAQVGAVLALRYGLNVQRAPENLAASSA